MKIKFQIPRGLVKRNKPLREYHWWLQEKEPKKAGRLAQLSRRNTRTAQRNHQLRLAEGSAEKTARDE